MCLYMCAFILLSSSYLKSIDIHMILIDYNAFKWWVKTLVIDSITSSGGHFLDGDRNEEIVWRNEGGVIAKYGCYLAVVS